MRRLSIALLPLVLAGGLYGQFQFSMEVVSPQGNPAVVSGTTVAVRVRASWLGWCEGGPYYITYITWQNGSNSGTLTQVQFESPCAAGFWEGEGSIELQPGINFITFNSCILRSQGVVVACVATNLEVTTCQTTECGTPKPFSISSTSANSITLSTSAGCRGGTLLVSGGQIQRSFSLLPGSQSIPITSLSANTSYSICQTETCSYGQSQPYCQTVKTASNDNSNGYLAPPSFIQENQLGISSRNRLEILFTDPNSDGWDRFGSTSLAYFLSIRQDCETLYETTISGMEWPLRFEVPIELPASSYLVEISRGTPGQKAGPRSSGTVLVGPSAGSGSQTVPTTADKLNRWLLHIPKISGGFLGELLLENRFPDLPATVYLVAFDAEGNRVGGVQNLILVGQSASKAIYNQSGASGIFGDEFKDKISHLALWEPGNKRVVTGFVRYKSAAASQPLPAAVREQDLESGALVANQFTVEARSSASYWDGVAITNLRGSATATISASLREMSTDREIAFKNLGSLQPGRKMLSVLTSQFPFQANTYYSIESNAPIQVVGLRGNLSNTLMVESEVVRKK
jgi:hypothetical protein